MDCSKTKPDLSMRYLKHHGNLAFSSPDHSYPNYDFSNADTSLVVLVPWLLPSRGFVLHLSQRHSPCGNQVVMKNDWSVHLGFAVGGIVGIVVAFVVVDV